MVHSLTASDVLRAWELAHNQFPVERALTLLALATGHAPHELAALPIGQRDALLLALRQSTLGRSMAARANCPACGERVEMNLDTAELLLSASDPLPTDTLTLDDPPITFRPPNSLDLLAIRHARSISEARRTLIECCVLEAPGELTPEIEAALAERITQADPLADIVLELACPNCEHRWQTLFDVAAFLWGEINDLAQRLLQDVHTLASAYGWHEADILAMSATRRAAYVEMALG